MDGIRIHDGNPGAPMKRCPYCAEPIQVAAVFCRYCRRELHVIAGESVQSARPRSADRVRWRHLVLAVALAGMVTTVPSMILLQLINDGRIDIPSDATLDRILFASLLPVLLCGLWTSWAWQGRGTVQYAALGLIAAVIDLLLVGGLLGGSLPRGPVAEWVPFEIEEVLAAAGILALFTAGAVGGELARRSRPSRRDRRTGLEPALTGAGSERGLRLTQALGPSALTLAGTIFAHLGGSPLS